MFRRTLSLYTRHIDFIVHSHFIDANTCKYNTWSHMYPEFILHAMTPCLNMVYLLFIQLVYHYIIYDWNSTDCEHTLLGTIFANNATMFGDILDYFSFRCPVLLTWMAGDKWLTQLVQRCFLAHRSFRCCVPWQMKEWMTEYDGWTKITTDYFFLQGLVDHLAPTIDCFLSRIVVVKMCGSKLISLRLLQPILGKMKTIPGELA